MSTTKPCERLNADGSAKGCLLGHAERLKTLHKGPISFWFLNHWLEEEELIRQIRELKDKGFAGFFMHPRGGLHVPYGSEQWYAIIEICVREARRQGMEAWLYDEDPYPSGAAGGKVIWEHPHLRASQLIAKVVDVQEPGELVVDLLPGQLAGVYLVCDGEIQSIDACAGIVRSDWRQRLSHSSYYPPYSIEGGPHWRAETYNPHYRVVCEVTKPGTKLIAFVRQYAEQTPWGAFPDLLNPEATRAFIRYTHEEYFKRFGHEFGETIPGVFTDESKLKGMLAWSEGLPQIFQEVCGLSLKEVLPYLVLDIDERSEYIRWAFREALAIGFMRGFVDPVRQVCEEFRLLWTGHMSPEEDPLGQAVMVPGLLRVLRKMDIPGTDLIGSHIGNAQRPLLHLSPKIASSAAHFEGKTQVGCEAFAVMDWVQDISSMTDIAHWLFALGVNRLITHGQYYSIDGLRKREAPPSQFIQSSYWEHFRYFSDSVRLLSESLTEGVHDARLLLYYPEESFMVYAHDQEQRKTRASEQRKKLGECIHELLISGYDFDLADAQALSDSVADRDQIRIGEERYRALIVPGHYLTKESWNKIQEFWAKGIKVYVVESALTVLGMPLLPVTGAGCELQDMIADLRKSVVPQWLSDGELFGHKRLTEHGALLFLYNNGAQDYSGRVQLDFSGPYEFCDPVQGKWQYVGEVLELDLTARRGVLVRQAQGQCATPYLARKSWQPADVQWSTWKLRYDRDNTLVLHEFRKALLPVSKRGDLLPDEVSLNGGNTVDLLSPAIAIPPYPAAGKDRYLMTSFDCYGKLDSLRLVVDTEFVTSGQQVEFYLNRQRIDDWQRKETFDPMNREAELSPWVQAGRNFLMIVQYDYGEKSMPWPYDAVRLYGDFEVEFPYGRTVPASLKPRRSEYELGGVVSPQQTGHPYYSGVLEYSVDFDWSHDSLPERCMLSLGHVYETVEVWVNQHLLGCLWGDPGLLEMDAAILRPGKNRLELRCTTSPSNYLQAYRRDAGVKGPVQILIPR